MIHAIRWLALFTVLLVAGPAQAATVVGNSAPGGTPLACTPQSFVQAASAANNHLVPPGGGVITEWRYQADAVTAQLALRVFSRTGATSTFTALAESEPRSTVPNTVNKFPTRISVSGGELIGLRVDSGGSACLFETFAPGDVYHQSNFALPLNTPTAFGMAFVGYHVAVAAVLEPDADHDGFGDESQDQCPADPTKQDCTPPAAPSIDKRPKKKTGSAKATIGFSSAEAGVTFECRADKAAFAPCAGQSKLKKLKARKHTFRVHAIDAAGNVGSDAVVRWRVT
ncbi:MAG: hypothetical protein QOG62_586 [Thermoleophilaceae bacterium]|jgi:hypothetical protein|nr:hypothetical protein [Thermoleophilaceae bacterium]